MKDCNKVTSIQVHTKDGSTVMLEGVYLSYMYLMTGRESLSVSREFNWKQKSFDSDWLSAAAIWYGQRKL